MSEKTLGATLCAFVVKFIFLFFSFTIPLFAQEMPIAAEEHPVEEPAAAESENTALSPERQRAEMEIRTSTLSELAAWCRTLGLSEGGTREELSRRLRDHFSLPEPGTEENNNRKVITIESAQTTEYFTLEVVDEDYARLRGDVIISLKDEDTIHRIRANEILFNRTRNILTARGQVVYEKIDGEKVETFRGENITVNIDNWASTFLDGNTQHEINSDGTVYLFSGAVISRSDEDVTILSNARVTNAATEEPYWSITATRLWLLPGSDFALFNAVLKVGEIPVLYIPFFYYPGDDLFFHPVVGYRSREGGYIQTTTYILGQPSADSSEANSISKIFLNADDSEREIQGLFLRSTGRRRINQEEISLKALLDYYVNLGLYLGFDLTVPKTGIINQTTFDFGLGFSRTVSSIGNNTYTPYHPNYDGSFDWNHSNFFSMEVPFRYRMKWQSSLGGRYGGLAWDFSYYSDPYIDRDFTVARSENMDFFNIIQEGFTIEDLITQGIISSPRWHMNSSLNPSLPGLSPFISRVSISNLSTTLTFKSIRDTSFGSGSEAPGREFFAPDRYTIYNVTASISGTPLTIGGTQTQSRTNTDNAASRETNDPFNGIGIPISPWTNDENEQIRIQSTEILIPPVINQNFDLANAGNTKFTIDYVISPTSSTELQFWTNNWNTYNQVDWSDVQSIQTIFGGNTNINFRIDHTANLFSNTFSLSGNGTWMDLTYQNEDAETQSKREEARRLQYSRTFYTSSYSYNGTIRPFLQNSVFRSTNFQYGFKGTLVRSRRYTPGTDHHELRPQWGSWVKENASDEIYGLTSHHLTANISANVLDKVQTLNVSAVLPPLNGMISTNATFRFWISETNVSFRVEKPEDSNEWLFRPITVSETLTFNNIGSLSGTMIITPELNNEITTIRSALVLGNFRTDFSAIRTNKYEFTMTGGSGSWESVGEPELLPHELKFTYNTSSRDIELFKNRLLLLSFDTRSTLTFDLQRYTNSNFNFTLGTTLKIPGFLEFSVAMVSENTVIWRYFKDIPGMEDLTFMYPDGPQNNVFIDFFDSFNFFDEDARRRSGFKMNRLDISAKYLMSDWTAELRVNLYPHHRINSYRYEITADVSFTVTWIPISEINSNVMYHGRTDRWEVQ